MGVIIRNSNVTDPEKLKSKVRSNVLKNHGFGAKSTPNRLLYDFKLTILGAYLELWEPPQHLQFQIMCLGGLENHPGQYGELWVGQNPPYSS